MARYLEDPTILRTDSGKRYYSTVVPETYTSSTFPLKVTARLGDRWDTLAYRFLGNAALWYAIANANGGANVSIFISPGTEVIIPEI